MRHQYGLALACLLVMLVSLVSPPYPREQWLQHVPSVVALAAMLAAIQQRWLSTTSLLCVAALLTLHIVGARWIYSYVPYDQWCERVCGRSISDMFDWQRNHYDRFVHLAFGLLVTPPVVEISQRRANLRLRAAVGFACLTVLAVSAAYEIFEWLLAMIAAPEYAERYNGQQGDPWDAQKDMALAAVGSMAAAAVLMGRGSPASYSR